MLVYLFLNNMPFFSYEIPVFILRFSIFVILCGFVFYLKIMNSHFKIICYKTLLKNPTIHLISSCILFSIINFLLLFLPAHVTFCSIFYCFFPFIYLYCLKCDCATCAPFSWLYCPGASKNSYAVT